MENFPWTRIAGVELPEGAKPAVPREKLVTADATRLRQAVGDGNYHGLYRRPDEDMLAIWRVAVAETRELLETGW